MIFKSTILAITLHGMSSVFASDSCPPLLASEVDKLVRVSSPSNCVVTDYLRTSRPWNVYLRILRDSLAHPGFEASKLSLLESLEPAQLRPKRVLDAGCGGGDSVMDLINEGVVDATGIDILLMKHLLGNSNFIQRDLRATGLPTGHYDVAISVYSLFSYTSDYQLVTEGITELARVVANGGILALFVVRDENILPLSNTADLLRLNLIYKGASRSWDSGYSLLVFKKGERGHVPP
jgi:SAM-dependent methyltransferase